MRGRRRCYNAPMVFRLRPIQGKVPLIKADRAAFSRIIRERAASSVDRLSNYPPQLPTDYARTGTLGRNWSYQMRNTGRTLAADITNATPYADYVQGPNQTREMSRRNWPQAVEILEDEVSKMGDDLRKAMGQ